MSLGSLTVVPLPVSDQRRAKEFYMETLGFTLVRDDPLGGGRRWVQLEPPGGGAGIALVTGYPTVPPGAVKGLVISCDDLEATRAELTGRGVQLAGPIREVPWGRSLDLEDPDGNGWTVHQDAPDLDVDE